MTYVITLGMEGGSETYANVVGLLKVIKIEFTTSLIQFLYYFLIIQLPLAYYWMIAKPQSSDCKI